jgi:cell wall-associated NlpC family hydrolase
MKHRSHWHKPALVLAILLALTSGTALAAPILSLNSHGHDVLQLQKELKAKGYYAAVPDGLFSKNTQKAVLTFQQDHQLSPTGVVDRTTWKALQGASQRPWGSNVKPPAHPSAGAAKVPESQPFLARGSVTSLLATARKYIGVPYRFGGSTPTAFDCSGYLQYVFRENGLSIPRTADEQYKLGRRTASSSQLVPGDLVFFTTYEPGASHCGIYLGDGQFIHASSSKGVRIDKLSNSYWQPRYYGGKHIVK